MDEGLEASFVYLGFTWVIPARFGLDRLGARLIGFVCVGQLALVGYDVRGWEDDRMER